MTRDMYRRTVPAVPFSNPPKMGILPLAEPRQCILLGATHEREMSQTRILCVDDDRQINELNHIFLTRAGYEVETVATPAEALGRLSNASYDLIITDLFLSGNSSITDREFVINLRKAVPDTPIILASGEHHPPEEILKLVNGFIQKAYSPNLLVDSVREVLGRTKERKVV